MTSPTARFTPLDWETALRFVCESLLSRAADFSSVCASRAIVIVRDWYGHLSVCLPCHRSQFDAVNLATWDQNMATQLELLAPNGQGIVVCEDELFDPDDIWKSPDLVAFEDEQLKIYLLDRQDKESDWLRAASPLMPRKSASRAVFFGVKGGVGRSSALTALAIKLANEGRKVLAIDLDFESPGISSVLLDQNVQPNLGVVDWLTADALGYLPNALEDLITSQLVETSPLSKITKGRIVVAPAHVKNTEAYVSKLGRLYRTTQDNRSFAERLNKLISSLEQSHQIDVTLIDSRAGIDDTAAAAITQLQADVSFLFAINTPQTWDAYGLLFEHLKRHPSLHTDQDFRASLKMVSAITPAEVGSYKGYFEDFQTNAYDLCSHIYDEDDGRDDQSLFAPSIDDDASPHAALKIMWNEALRAFDPLREPGQLAPQLMDSIFGDFVQKASLLLPLTQKVTA